MSARPRLPDGFVVRLSTRAQVCDDGRTLVGGTRGSVLFLREVAVRLVLSGEVVVRDPTSARLARRLLDAGLADPTWPVPPPRARDVTVVVPVHDRAFELDRLLRTLGEHDPGLPVIVVDDGSVDPHAVAVVADRHGARLVRHPVDRGPAAARNTGLRAAQTPYVAFCDSDVVPTSGWLRRLRPHLDDPAVALVAPRVLGLEPTQADGVVTRYEQARSSLDLGPLPGEVRAGTPVAYVPSACLLARVEALREGFDESMRVAEDVDLVWRLTAEGWTVRYEPEARVRHDHRTEPRAWLARKAFYGTGAGPLARLHGPAVAPMVLSPWSALLVAALLAQRRWSVPVATGALGVALIRVRGRLAASDHPTRLAAVLAARGAVAAVQQTSHALVRHHWPLALAAALASTRARRVLLLAALLDGALEPSRQESGLPLPTWLLLRRLDDLAYGAGVWRGAVTERSVRALLPHVRWSSSDPHRSSGRAQNLQIGSLDGDHNPPNGATTSPETSQTHTGSGPPRSGWM